MGLKLTIRYSLLGSCALLLLAPACVTSSKTGKQTFVVSKKKATAAPVVKAESSSKGKSEAPAAAKPAKAPVVVEAKKKPAPPAPPAPPPEPDLPTRFPHPLHCPTPSEVQPGIELIIRCAVKPALATKSVVLQYRPSGTDHFETADAVRSPKGWFVAKIRAAEVKGTSLQFFAQAYNANNRVTASNGSDESPNILLIHKGAGGSDQPVADDDPLAHIHNQIAAENAQRNEGRRSPAPNWWLALGTGTGWGWFPTRTPENYTGAKVKGWSFGGVLHLLPEIGYQWTKQIMFSLQGRYQFVHTDMGAGCVGCASPKSMAWAVLGRAYLLSDGLFGRASNLQLFGVGTLGGGTAFRLYVPPHPDPSKPNADFKTSDTVNGGPFVIGLGGGLVYNFTNSFALAAELRALLGFWNIATVFEGSLSARMAIWSPGAPRAPVVKPETELEPEPNPDFPPAD